MRFMRRLQLRIAVAAQRMEDVAGHAAAMDADDRVLVARLTLLFARCTSTSAWKLGSVPW